MTLGRLDLPRPDNIDAVYNAAWCARSITERTAAFIVRGDNPSVCV